jgi:hypothetical protein
MKISPPKKKTLATMEYIFEIIGNIKSFASLEGCPDYWSRESGCQ